MHVSNIPDLNLSLAPNPCNCGGITIIATYSDVTWHEANGPHETAVKGDLTISQCSSCGAKEETYASEGF